MIGAITEWPGACSPPIQGDGAMLTHMPSGIEKRRFNVDEYYAMARAGILSERDRVELIEGEIVTMSPIGVAHAAAVDRAAQTLMRSVAGRSIVRVQNPIRVDTFSEPQPDLTLLRPREDFYRTAHPGPADILLVIEIADASLRYDRHIKAPLYARHGIVEYWLVDLAAGTVTSYTSPDGATYRAVAVHARGEMLTPIALPDCTLTVDDLL
jgi:Uma2 family endonuclease